MTASTEPATARPPYLALRIVLVLFSLFEFLYALTDLTSLPNPDTTPTISARVAVFLSDARTVLAPPIAAAALVFAIAGMLPRAVAAMATLLLVNACAGIVWAFSVGSFWLPLDLITAQIMAPRYVYPLLAVAALVLLRRGGRLGLAGTLVLIPTGMTLLYWIVVIVLLATYPD